jgi:hypothetical protein
MSTLREANERLLVAIETSPDTGDEERLDRLAADLWYHAQGEEGPDAGHLCRLRHELRTLAERSHEPRARELRRARDALGEYATTRREARPA